MHVPLRLPFRDRTSAGRALGSALQHHAAGTDVIVLALPRGGVPVAVEVARALNAPLDVMIVRRLGTPGHAEVAMGAVASGGITCLNAEVIQAAGVSMPAVETQAALQRTEIERRERLYRGNRPPVALSGRCAILVDDGAATGASMRAAVTAVRTQHPARIVVAVPVAARDALEVLRQEADEVVCLAAPRPFNAVGQWYGDFRQIEDEEVQALLQRHWRTREDPLTPSSTTGATRE